MTPKHHIPNVLAPCPFCGSSLTGIIAEELSAVVCENCLASGPAGVLGSLYGFWNIRGGPPVRLTSQIRQSNHSTTGLGLDAALDCPFCLYPHIVIPEVSPMDWSPRGIPFRKGPFRAACPNCEARGPETPDPETASYWWNQRVEILPDGTIRHPFLWEFQAPRNFRYAEGYPHDEGIDGLLDWLAEGAMDLKTLPADDDEYLTGFDFLFQGGKGEPVQQEGTSWTPGDEYNWRNGLGRFWNPCLGWDVKKDREAEKALALGMELLVKHECRRPSRCRMCKGMGYLPTPKLKTILEHDKEIHAKVAPVPVNTRKGHPKGRPSSK